MLPRKTEARELGSDDQPGLQRVPTPIKDTSPIEGGSGSTKPMLPLGRQQKRKGPMERHYAPSGFTTSGEATEAMDLRSGDLPGLGVQPYG